MIIDEYLKTRKDGVVLNRAYSDLHVYIIDDEFPDVKYAEVVYPAHLTKHFTETDEPIPEDDPEDVTEDE